MVALALVPGPLGAFAAHAGGHPVLKLRVEVSREGLNGRPDLVIEAEQGQRVEMTFVWADMAVPDNAHLIYIKGYELSTDLLSSEHRTHTLSFVADAPGTFEVVCVWPCEGHLEALQGGRLRVTPVGGGTGGQSLTATGLALRSLGPEAGGAVRLRATLADDAGNPIPNVPVRFFVEAELAGTRGLMEIGSAVTDSRGVASLVYAPTFPGEQRLTARFEGVGLYAESEGTARLDVPDAVPAYTSGPPGLAPLPRLAAAGLVALVLGVWATFAYVIYQVLRIRRAIG